MKPIRVGLIGFRLHGPDECRDGDAFTLKAPVLVAITGGTRAAALAADLRC